MNLECNMMHMNASYSCLQKFTPILMMTAMFKINKLESTLCNDCGHTTNNDGIGIDWSLH